MRRLTSITLISARSGYSGFHPYLVDEGCELLLAILHAISNRIVFEQQAVQEFFLGVWCEASHLLAWLQGRGLIESREATLEGRAVMRMLAAT